MIEENKTKHEKKQRIKINVEEYYVGYRCESPVRFFSNSPKTKREIVYSPTYKSQRKNK